MQDIGCADCAQGAEIKARYNDRMEAIKTAHKKLEQDGNKLPEKKSCTECGQKPTIHPNSPFCASCLAKRSRKNKRRSQSAPVKTKSKRTGQSMPKSQNRAVVEWQALAAVFQEHDQVLNKIGKLATEEVRPIEHQIVLMLRDQLKARKIL